MTMAIFQGGQEKTLAIAIAALCFGILPADADESRVEKGTFKDPGWCVWCPSAVELDDGRIALVHSRWEESKTHNAWVSDSVAALAIAEGPGKPFKFEKVILAGSGKEGGWDRDCVHNPTVVRIKGKYYMYYMGCYGQKGDWWSYRNNQKIGVATADRIEGPWTRCDKPLVDSARYGWAVCNNPSVCEMPDGRFLMVFKYVEKKLKGPFYGPVRHAAAIASAPTGPFEVVKLDLLPVPGVMFPGEDPFVWREGDKIICTIHDIATYYSDKSKALIRFESKDGLNWRNCGVLMERGKIDRLERPNLIRLANGERWLFAAAKPNRKSDESIIVYEKLR